MVCDSAVSTAAPEHIAASAQHGSPVRVTKACTQGVRVHGVVALSRTPARSRREGRCAAAGRPVHGHRLGRPDVDGALHPAARVRDVQRGGYLRPQAHPRRLERRGRPRQLLHQWHALGARRVRAPPSSARLPSTRELAWPLRVDAARHGAARSGCKDSDACQPYACRVELLWWETQTG